MPTYNSAPDPMSLIPGLLTVQGLAGRQSEERINYDIKSQVLVQLGQYGGIVFAIFSIGAGLFALAQSLLWVLGQFTELTTILAAGIIGAFLLIVGRVLRGTFDLMGWHERAWHSFAEWLGAVTLTLFALSVAQAITESWDWKRGILLLAGLAGAIGGAFLIWRYTNELRNPAYPAPPVIDLLREIVAHLWPDNVPDQARGRLVPYSSGNGSRPLGVGTGLLNEDDADLIEFAERAASVGLSRRAWLGQKLNMSGNIVTQDRHIALIRRLVDFGYVQSGGEGHPARWRVDPLDAVAELRRQAEELTREG